MKPFERIQPRTWDEAVAALEAARKAGVRAEAKGAGTDLLDRLKERTAAPDRIVDLRRLEGHEQIGMWSNGYAIGALATLSSVVKATRGLLPALAEACEGAATPQIRNVATIGGNLCQRPRCWYFRSADFTCLKKGGSQCFAQDGESQHHAIFGNQLCAMVHPSAAGVALLAYGALLQTVHPTNPRQILIEEFFSAPEQAIDRENSLAPAELIGDILVPHTPEQRSAYRKVKQKQTFDWPLADAAVVFSAEDSGVAYDVRIVIGSASPVPFRARKAEALVEGRKIDAALAARAAAAAVDGATPLARNGYKTAIVSAVVRRALLAAAGLPDGTEPFTSGR